MVILLLTISLIIYKDNKQTYTHLVIYLSLLIVLYLILSIIPNFEHFKIYDNTDPLVDLYKVNQESEEIEDLVFRDNKNEVVKYGDKILIKCLSKENRYLSGGRGGNLLNTTNMLNEYVFTTDEEELHLKWIIRSNIKFNELDPLFNKPVKYGDAVYIQTTNINDRFLVGGIEKNNLPYSNNAFEEAATISSKFNRDDNLVWFIKSEVELTNNDSKNNQNVNYLDSIVLKSNAGDNLFLSGARGSYVLDDTKDTNQEVYSIKAEDGKDLEMKWCFTKNKINLDLNNTCNNKLIKWPLWDYEPGIIGKNNWKTLFTSSSCEGHIPYINNLKTFDGNKSSDLIFGEPCLNGSQDGASWKITKDNNGWIGGNNKCIDEFVVINFAREVFIEKIRIYSRKDFPHNNQYIKEFSIKTARKNGIFLDFKGNFKTNFGIPWFKTGSQVIFKTYNDKVLKMNYDGNIIPTSLFDKKLYSDEIFYVIKNNDDTVSFRSQRNTLIKVENTIVTQSDVFTSLEIPASMNDCKFKIIHHENGQFSLKTKFNTYLKFDLGQMIQSPVINNELPESWVMEKFNIIQTNSDDNNYYEVYLNKELQFLKIIPTKSHIGCSMRVSAYGKSSDIDLIELLKEHTTLPIKASSCMNFKNGEITSLTDGTVCSYGGYETSKLNTFSNSSWSLGKKDLEGKAFILVDLGKESCIKGGIVYSRDNYDDEDCLSCDQYVKKFKIQIAGNNKLFSDIGEFITDLKGNSPGKFKGFKFDINKNNVRFVKMILIKCNKHCSMRLDLF